MASPSLPYGRRRCVRTRPVPPSLTLVSVRRRHRDGAYLVAYGGVSKTLAVPADQLLTAALLVQTFDLPPAAIVQVPYLPLSVRV